MWLGNGVDGRWERIVTRAAGSLHWPQEIRLNRDPSCIGTMNTAWRLAYLEYRDL